SGLDRSPDPFAAFRLPRRAPPPLGYFAETSHAATGAHAFCSVTSQNLVALRATGPCGLNDSPSFSIPVAPAPSDSADLAQAAALEILERLDELLPRVHDERPVSRDRLMEGSSRDEERAKLRARVRFERDLVSVITEPNQIVAPRRSFLAAKDAFSFDDVGERVEFLGHALDERRAGRELGVEIDNRRSGFDDGLGAQGLARNDAYSHLSVGRAADRDAARRDLLISRRHHFVACRKVDPELKAMHPAARLSEGGSRHLRVHDSRAGGHPLDVAGSELAAVAP